MYHLSFGENRQFQKGFTLIELLVGMVILLSVGTIIVSILFSSLRGANKTNTITLVRQNGDYTITQMTKTIRNAKSFNGVSNDGVNYSLVCSPSPGSYTFIKITSLDGTQTAFSFSSCTSSSCPSSSLPPTIFSNANKLLDTSVCLVCTAPHEFTCSQQSASDGPTIGITFSLSANTQSTLFEQAAILPFSTTVSMRNIPR